MLSTHWRHMKKLHSSMYNLKPQCLKAIYHKEKLPVFLQKHYVKKFGEEIYTDENEAEWRSLHFLV